MKKILFLLTLLLITATTFAQVTATIDKVVTDTKGRFKGDSVTFTVSAPHNTVWGISLQYVYDVHNGHNGIDCPDCNSYTTQTYTIFVAYFGNLPKERTYKIQVLFEPNPNYPTPDDYNAVIYSEPVTVTK